MKLNDKILKGLNVGVKQTVGIMGVYPLIGEDLNVEMATFKDVKFIGNNNYGELMFWNNSNKPFILPTCHAIMTKQAAQDHSTTFATVLSSGYNKITNACCIQQTQGGYIVGDKCLKDGEGFTFLPLEIRKNIMFDNKDNISNYMSFSRLWQNIIDFQKELIKKYDGNLIYFFTKFLDQLSRFNAEFEIVDNQRGAIITFNDEIVGIEITPTHEYFKNIWQSLIRDSYGSAMIKMAQMNIKDTFNNSSNLDLSKCTELDEIIHLIQEDYINTQSNILFKIMNLAELNFEDKVKQNDFIKKNSEFFQYKIMIDTKKEYGTEFFINNDEIIYLSLIKK